MAASALAPLLGAGGAAAGGAAAGGAAAGGLLSSGLVGSLVSGAAAGWMKGMSEKKENKRRIEEEQRREQRYSGLGEAVRFWDNGQQQQQTPSQEIAAQPALGKNPDMVGQKYRERAERNRTKMPKYRYDRRSGMIETG